MADIKEIMGRIIDVLYAGLTGGEADIPLPANMKLQWIQPGIPFHPSEFDFAIAGPFAGPSPLTLGFFRDLVATIQGDNQGMSRDEAIQQAKAMYQQHLLGTWENWSRLVDFIPLLEPSGEQNNWHTRKTEGRNPHTQVVYGQAGHTLSQVYGDVLRLCLVADDDLSDDKKKLIDRMRSMLQEEVQTEDFLSGDKHTEIRDSRVMQAYKEYQAKYENAVLDYASRLARSQSGTAADLVEWSRSGGIYRSRALQARRDWEGQGYKNDVERAQAVLDQLIGTSMVQWAAALRGAVNDVEDNIQGSFGYSFFPATVIPGSFARNDGWATYENHELHKNVQSSSTTRRGAATVGFALGLFGVSAGGGGGRTESDFQLTESAFGMKFDYTRVQIARPGWFNPGFFSSRGWKLKTEFVENYQTNQLSDGKEKPAGAMIGFPTSALFVRDLTIYSRDLARHMKTRRDDIAAGGAVGWGPFLIGGGYQQSSVSGESNLDVTDASVHIPGLQCVAFLSAVLPQAPNPSPDIEKWL
jgi:hypothetical protein